MLVLSSSEGPTGASPTNQRRALNPIHDECVGRIPFPPSQVWPILSKTDWLNRSLGLPSVAYSFEPQEEGGARVSAHAKLLGMDLRWKELPFEWVHDQFHVVNRLFETGAAARGRLGVQLSTAEDGTTVVRAHSELEPRNRIGGLVLRHVVGPAANRSMRKVIAHVTEHLRGAQRDVLPKLPKKPAAEIPLQAGLKKLRQHVRQEALIVNLERMLRDAPDVELSHLRPFAVARNWKGNRWEVLRLFLHATRSGLLDLSWEVLCPYCRSARQVPARSLGDLQTRAHCDVCQIKFDADFDKSVELKFSVNANIRPVDHQIFCVAGPGGTPHIAAQYYLAPNERRACQLPQVPGTMRLRSPQIREALTFKPGSFPNRIVCRPDTFEPVSDARDEEQRVAEFTNPNLFPIRLALENVAWSDDILTASRVTSWQDFRDLFESQMISPRERFTVRSQVILFTDLRGSTAMYNKVGDALAYVMVRNHFEILVETIRQHNGAVIKTIGDAVMASFSGVEDALAAARRMHHRMAEITPPPGIKDRVTLKSGLHVGPCLAVNANDKLDFFGTTINLAARLVGCCKGGDLTVSDELYQRPETAQFLQISGKAAEQTELRFRGFDRPHTVWRIVMI